MSISIRGGFRRCHVLSMNYLSMTFLDDPSMAELLDDTGDVKFGRMRMQEWLEPLRVMLQTPPEADRSAELAQRARLDCLADPSESRNSNLPALEFVIHTRWAKNMPRDRRIRPSQEILERFLGLASATDQEIYGFGRRYGPLLIYCKSAYQNEEIFVREQVDVWRYFARSLNALLRIAAGLQARRPTQALQKNWDILAAMPSVVRNTEHAEDRPEDLLRPATPLHPEKEWAARAYFAGYGKHRDRAMWVGLMNCLLELARTRPWLLWDGSATVNLPRLVFSGPNLLSYLALQVCFLAAKQDAALCTHCQNLYKPKRAPKAGQRNYCPTCRNDGIPVRMAKRDQLARLRQAREI
jgi:hypothetical protein